MADELYEMIDKDAKYYTKEGTEVNNKYCQHQKELCENFINKAREEQHSIQDQIAQLQERHELLQHRKELIKDRDAFFSKQVDGDEINAKKY